MAKGNHTPLLIRIVLNLSDGAVGLQGDWFFSFVLVGINQNTR